MNMDMMNMGMGGMQPGDFRDFYREWFLTATCHQ